MEIPGRDKGIIPVEKIRDYLLSHEHPIGKFKAKFFYGLGYSRQNWKALSEEVYRILRQGNVMKYVILDTVVLNKDIAEHGLKAGDVGAIVEIYEPDGIEVEFVAGSGATQALLTLKMCIQFPVGKFCRFVFWMLRNC